MTDSDPAFEALLEFLRDGRAFDYTGYRRPSLMRRFEKRMQDGRREELRRVQGPPRDASRGVRGALQHDPDQRHGVLPRPGAVGAAGARRPSGDHRGDGREPDPRLVGGCASGEEPYTVAMLLREALGDDAFRERAKIYATDIDDHALAQAREALFTPKEVENVPPELREQYFQRSTTATVPERLPPHGHLRPKRPASRTRRSPGSTCWSRGTRSCTSPPARRSGSSRTSTSRFSRRGYLLLGQGRGAAEPHATCSRRTTSSGGSSSRTRTGASRTRAGATAAGHARGRLLAHARLLRAGAASRRSSSTSDGPSRRNHAARAMFGLAAADIGRPSTTSSSPTGRSSCARCIDQACEGRRS